MIAAEDTRHTRKLLAHYNISTPLQSYHSHNQQARGEELLGRLCRGDTVALVSDAGMPGISDPGAALIREALARRLRVEVLPGPSAVLTAIVASGFDTSGFVFEGFLPVKHRRRALENLVNEERTVVIFEGPHRLLATLKDIMTLLGDRPVAVARELTKIHEQVFRGTVSNALEHFQAKPPKGEITIVLAGAKPEKEDAISDDGAVYSLVQQLTAEGMQKRAAIKETARRFGVSSRKVYAIVENLKG